MADDFYPFVDSGDPAPDNAHITGGSADTDAAAHGADETSSSDGGNAQRVMFATRISIYDDMLSTPRVIVVDPKDVRTYLEEVTNTVYRCMKEQGGSLTLMVIRELVENLIHANFVEPIISILDGGNTIRFADQGPGIADKERAFEFGVTSADKSKKRYIRGTGAGFPMVQQYLEAVHGAISIEDNLGSGTVVTVTVDPARVEEIERHGTRGAAVRASEFSTADGTMPALAQNPSGIAQAPGDPVREGMGAPGAVSAQGPTGTWPQRGYPYMQPQMYPSPYGQPYQMTPQSGYQAGYPIPGAGYAQGMPQQGMTYPQGAPYSTGARPDNACYPYGAGAAGVPQGFPMGQNGFPQLGHEFSTMYQNQFQPAGSPAQDVSAHQDNQNVFISERARLALSFIHQHEQAGPTELATAFGQSGPTWSRELGTLSKQGFIAKQGQKYHLTDLGMAWIQSH